MSGGVFAIYIMKSIKLFLFAIITSTMFVMCTEDLPELSDVAIFVTPPSDSIVVLESGHKAQYKLDISTPHKYISQFTISSFDRENGTIEYLDSICNTNKIKYIFEYTAPEVETDSLDVKLKFKAFDNNGNEAEVIYPLLIKNRFVSVGEKTGIVLYNPHIGMPDALSLEDVSQTFVLATSPDSLSADIYVVADEHFNEIAWKSKTKTKFIRNNTFNYVSATATSINSVYQSSVREDQIENIQINDIILVGHDNTADGVFQVKNIIRSNEYGNVACMQLSFKGIRH